MAKVKCRFCGKQIDKNSAFVVKHGRNNWYYCSEEHSVLKAPKEETLELIYEIIGITSNTVLFKELKELSSFYSFDKIQKYLIENKTMLDRVMNKNFSSEYAKLRYFFAILKNNLSDFIPSKPEKTKDIQVEIYEPIKRNKNKVKIRKGMDDLLKEIIND